MIGKISDDTEKLCYILQKNETVNIEALSQNQGISANQNIAASQARGTQDTVNISEEARKLSEEFIAEAADKAVHQQNIYADKAHSHKTMPDHNDDDDESGLWCTVNTDNVDAEIAQLKQNVKQIEQQIKNASNDEEKRQELERELLQAKSELSSKDTDTYRKANASYSYSKDDPLGS